LKGICASSWTVTKNHCMMHGQQNVKPNVVEILSFPSSSAYATDILRDKCCLNIILPLCQLSKVAL